MKICFHLRHTGEKVWFYQATCNSPLALPSLMFSSILTIMPLELFQGIMYFLKTTMLESAIWLLLPPREVGRIEIFDGSWSGSLCSSYANFQTCIWFPPHKLFGVVVGEEWYFNSIHLQLKKLCSSSALNSHWVRKRVACQLNLITCSQAILWRSYDYCFWQTKRGFRGKEFRWQRMLALVFFFFNLAVPTAEHNLSWVWWCFILFTRWFNQPTHRWHRCLQYLNRHKNMHNLTRIWGGEEAFRLCTD